MNEYLFEVFQPYCEQICDKWSPGIQSCLSSLAGNTNCYYTKEQKIQKMLTERHHLKAWTTWYVAQLRN